jgi:hypothetical protein
MAIVLGASVTLGGCGTEIVAGLTLGQLSTGISLVSTLFTGKGTTELAFDVVTGQDCRFLEGAMRSDRTFCEPHDSVATRDDFRGLMALLDDDAASGDPVAGVDPPPPPPGFGIGAGLDRREPLLQVAARPIVDEADLDALTAGTALDDPTPPSVLANARAFAAAGGYYPGGPAMIDTVRSVNIATQVQWTLAY